jgi:hypothetical protein
LIADWKRRALKERIPRYERGVGNSGRRQKTT